MAVFRHGIALLMALLVICIGCGALASENAEEEILDAAYYNDLGWHLLQEERYDEAIEAFTQAIALDATCYPAFFGRGQIHLWADHAQAAYDDLNEAYLLMPDEPRHVADRGVALYELGRYEEALRDFSQAIAMAPEEGMYYLNRGNTFWTMGYNTSAIDDYDQALVLMPDDPEIYLRRGRALFDHGAYEAALADYDMAAALVPDDLPIVYIGRGSIYRSMGRSEEAIESFEQAIAVSPMSAEPYAYMAYMAMDEKDYAAAEAHLTKAVVLAPNHVDYRSAYGVALFHQERFADAIVQFSKVISWMPDTSEAYYFRARCYVGLGDFDKAEQDIAAAIAIAPEVPAYLNLVDEISATRN